jgi:hypothetical protein
LFGVDGVLGQFHIRYMKHGHILCLVLGSWVVPLKETIDYKFEEKFNSV